VVDVQVFTPGTTMWNKPAGAVWVEMFCIGGGGGGGSGIAGAAGAGRFGGSGGGCGAWSRALYAAVDLPASLNVQCGAAGAGGASSTGNLTGGLPGAAGGDLT
jgi:hypothetical protein